MKFIELFAGIGGFRYGLEKSNKDFRCIFANEIDKYACQIYRKNFGEGKLYEGDIRTISTKSIPNFDLLTAGFPCQSFSIAGKRRGFRDTRGTLFFEICRIAEAKQPALLLLENVKGLLSHEKGNTFRVILDSLSKLGYDCEWEVLNSKNFGVPQNRERVFIVGHLGRKGKQKVFPIGKSNEVPTKGIKKALKYRNQKTVYNPEGISPTFREGHGDGIRIIQLNKDVSDAQRIFDTNGLAITLKALGGGQGAKTGLYAVIPTNTKLGYDVAEEKKDGIRLQYENSKTARGRVIKGYAQALQGGGQVGVLDNAQIRRLTPIECERLQGFPDDWTEGVSDTQRYKCLGNAVTTNVITEIGLKIGRG